MMTIYLTAVVAIGLTVARPVASVHNIGQAQLYSKRTLDVYWALKGCCLTYNGVKNKTTEMEVFESGDEIAEYQCAEYCEVRSAILRNT